MTQAMPPEPAAIAQRDVQPREVDLFMFSAATWLTHRIHFDRDYARTEGFEDLAELLSDAAGAQGGELARLSYRHHRPAYCADRLTLRATLSSVTEQPGGFAVDVDVTIRNAAGQPVTTGQARLRLPDQRAVAGLIGGGGTGP
jgi:hydroxyacyl-ACP dehydratase HTD2-like protein with hotdog domain